MKYALLDKSLTDESSFEYHDRLDFVMANHIEFSIAKQCTELYSKYHQKCVFFDEI